MDVYVNADLVRVFDHLARVLDLVALSQIKFDKKNIRESWICCE